MPQRKNTGIVRFSNSIKPANPVESMRKVTQLTRLSSTMEPLESRTLMSAGTLDLPPALSSPVKITAIKATKAPAKHSGAPALGTPSAVTAAAASRTEIDLHWSQTDSTASGFKVTRSTDGVHFTQIGTVTDGSTSYADTGLTAGTSYKYKVQAFRDSVTSAVSGVAAGVTMITAPSGLSVSATSSTMMHLTWTDNDSSAGAYLILRSTDGVKFSQLTKLTGASTASVDDKTVYPFTKYYYKVEAATASATSTPTDASSATTPLAVPASLAATALSPTSAKLTWTDAGANTITGYAVYRATGSGDFTYLGVVAGGKSITWTDTSLTSNTAYSYELKAQNGQTLSEASAVKVVTTPLLAPTTLLASTSSGGVLLSWTTPDTATAGFIISRATTDGKFTTLATLTDGTLTNYTDTTAQSGRKYSYQIVATASANKSAASNTAVATTAMAAPNGLSLSATTATSIVLAWTNHDSSATGYNILRSADGSTYANIAKVTGATVATYTDTTVASARTYYYKVQAYNTVAISAMTDSAHVTTPLVAPVTLAAKVTGSNINLSWTDKDTAATGYSVLRSTDGVTFTKLVDLSGGTVSSYADTAITAGTKYYYQVQAFNTSLTSPVSNIVNATVVVPQSNTTVTIATRYNNELVITATGTSDTVSISQSGSTLSITANGQTTTQTAPAAGLFIYLRGGADGITIDGSVNVRTTIEAIDNAVDDITNHANNVSIWDDSSDVVVGSGTVHSVSTFAGGVAKTAGASLKDPTDSGTITKASGSLWGTGPVAGDVNQGAVGDCYFLSSLAALAGVNPARLQESAVDMGDGTYTVQYISVANNNSPVFVRVSNDLPVYSGTSLKYARPGGSGSLWAAIMEKAFAFFRTGANTYNSISSGWMGSVYANLGVNSTWCYTTAFASDSAMYTELNADLTANKAVTFGTFSSPPGLVGGHAYTLVSVTQDSNGNGLYTVRNPWGVQGDSLENSQGYATLTYSQMEANFADVCEATS